MADNNVTRAELVSSLERFEDRLSHRMDERLQALSQRMEVQFDDIRSLVRLSFEAVGSLRETTERGFGEMRGDHEQKFVVLHRAVTELSQRVAALERQNR